MSAAAACGRPPKWIHDFPPGAKPASDCWRRACCRRRPTARWFGSRRRSSSRAMISTSRSTAWKRSSSNWSMGRAAARRLDPERRHVMKSPTKARFLMCAPDHFGVAYKINPWMDPHSWERSDRALAAASRLEWAALHRMLLELGAEIDLVPPAIGVPDLVFTANAAVVL